MDDKLLEKRLKSLKHSYDEMPIQNNKGKILDAVKTIEKPRRKIFHFPYVASFIGVGIITGILLMQFFSQDIATKDNSGAVEDRQIASESQIKQSFDELLNYFDAKQADLRKNLGIINISSVTFASHIRTMLDTELTQVLESEISTRELDEIDMKYKGIIDRDLVTPVELINKIADAKAEEERNSLTASLAGVYDNFYYNYRDLVNIDYKPHIMEMIRASSLEQTIEFLNNGYVQSEPGELRDFAEGANEIGYMFVKEDGYVAVKKDIKQLVEEIKPFVSDDFYAYFLLQEKERFNQSGILVIEWMDLAELLIQYEETYYSIENDWVRDNMKRDFSSLYSLMVLGHTSNPIFNENDKLKEEVKEAYLWIIENHPTSSIAVTLKVEYEALKEISFKKPADFSNKGILTPDFLQEREKMEPKGEKINESILPLSDELLSIYKQFQSKQDVNLLRGYGPFEIMRLYIHADAEKDYETMYELYSSNFALPPKEQYILERSSNNADPLIDGLKGYEYASLYHREDDPALITGVQLHFKDGMETRVFGMTKSKGIWKVNFLPFQ